METPIERQQILPLIEALRKAGVRRFEGLGVKVEFCSEEAPMVRAKTAEIARVDSKGNELTVEQIEEMERQEKEAILFHSAD